MQYPPPGAKAARTRAKILAAARELFARHGYAGASTRAVAARAGVNVATLRYHFGNKEALWRAALEDDAADAAPRLPGDLLDALAAVPSERARLSLHAFLAADERPEKPDASRVLPAVADVLALTLPGPERRSLRRRLLTSIARVAALDPPPRPASPRRRGRAR